MDNLIYIWALSNIMTVLSFIIGFYFGYGKRPKETIEDVRRFIRKGTTPVGPVNRPSAEKVNLWGNPRREAEDQAFKESFTAQTGIKP